MCYSLLIGCPICREGCDSANSKDGLESFIRSRLATREATLGVHCLKTLRTQEAAWHNEIILYLVYFYYFPAGDVPYFARNIIIQ